MDIEIDEADLIAIKSKKINVHKFHKAACHDLSVKEAGEMYSEAFLKYSEGDGEQCERIARLVNYIRSTVNI
jgi:hypothetical protein